ALTHFEHFLADRLNKPSGIVVGVSDSLPASAAGSVYSDSDARRLGNKYRRVYPLKDEFSVHYLFLDGGSAGDGAARSTKVLATATGNASLVIFENNLRQALLANPGTSGNPDVLSAVEATVMEQQFSRLLGLVHNPLADSSKHEDPAHTGYCRIEKCLMTF